MRMLGHNSLARRGLWWHKRAMASRCCSPGLSTSAQRSLRSPTKPAERSSTWPRSRSTHNVCKAASSPWVSLRAGRGRGKNSWSSRHPPVSTGRWGRKSSWLGSSRWGKRHCNDRGGLRGVHRPARTRRREDFPQPDGPVMSRWCPTCSVSERSVGRRGDGGGGREGEGKEKRRRGW